MLIDSHAHLDMFTSAAIRDQIVHRAEQAGVSTILTIGTTLEDSQANLEYARRYPQVFTTVGVHPHHVKEIDGQGLESALMSLASYEKVVAIGEIGLDFYRNISPPDLQCEVFRQQLLLARKLKLPVVIHDREAHQEVLRILGDVDATPPGGVFHCFSGDLRMAEQVRDLGFLIAIAGPITYKKPGYLPEIARRLPLDTLLVETDCPFLAPAPFRGKQNEPAYIRYTAEKVAELRNISVEEVAEVTSQNFARVFQPWGK